MGLIVKNAYQQSANLLTVSAYDITGVYNSVTNTTGYDSPNIAVGAFTTCTVSVYTPDPTTLLPISTAVVIDMFNTLPNTTGASYAIDSVDVFGQSQAWDDGVYKFIVTQSNTNPDPAITYTSEYLVPIFGQVRCCIKTKILLFPLNDSCNACNQKFINLLKADLMLDQLDANGRSTGGLSADETCTLYNKMAEQIIYCQSVCNSDCEPCASCNC